jgi:hypothetical protein
MRRPSSSPLLLLLLLLLLVLLLLFKGEGRGQWRWMGDWMGGRELSALSGGQEGQPTPADRTPLHTADLPAQIVEKGHVLCPHSFLSSFPFVPSFLPLSTAFPTKFSLTKSKRISRGKLLDTYYIYAGGAYANANAYGHSK